MVEFTKEVGNKIGLHLRAAGEFVKIAATIGLLVFSVRGYSDLHWPSMLIGLGLALQAGFLAFWKKS